MRKLTFVATTLLLCIVLITSHAQECLEIVESALNIAGEACDGLGRNQACYGNPLVEVDGTGDYTFDAVGDIADVVNLRSMSLSPFDDSTSQWGVSLFKIQANIPDTIPGQNVTMIAFGSTQVRNDVETGSEVSLTATQGVNIRTAPSSTNSVVFGSIASGDAITATGQYTNGAGERWIRVRYDGSPTYTGWVIDWLLTGDGMDSLESVASDSANFNPMQAFSFSAGIAESTCTEAPLDGLLIQTPSGVGRINLTINGIQFSIGSTAFLTLAEEEGTTYLLAATLQGRITVTIDGISQSIGAGQAAIIPVQVGDEDTVPAGLVQAPRSMRDVFADVGVPFNEDFFSLLLGLTPDSNISLAFASTTIVSETGETVDIPADVIIFNDGYWNWTSQYGWEGVWLVSNSEPGVGFVLDELGTRNQDNLWYFVVDSSDPNTYYASHTFGDPVIVDAFTITFTSPTSIVAYENLATNPPFRWIASFLG
jgi:hypothetical protein